MASKSASVQLERPPSSLQISWPDSTCIGSMTDSRRQKRPREGSIEEFQQALDSKIPPNYGTSPTEPRQSAEGPLACYPPPSGY
ncbi:hypothetical protein IFR05_010978, partial [Cadophora sp. M221]